MGKPSQLLKIFLWMAAFGACLALTQSAFTYGGLLDDLRPFVGTWATFITFCGLIGAFFRCSWKCAAVGGALFVPLLFALISALLANSDL